MLHRTVKLPSIVMWGAITRLPKAMGVELVNRLMTRRRELRVGCATKPWMVVLSRRQLRVGCTTKRRSGGPSY